MQQSETINELAAALAKAQGHIKGAAKDTNNPFFKSKYADLASVWEACRSALSDNGLSVVQTTAGDNAETVTVETQLNHSSGQWIRGSLTMKPTKADPQGMGSTITYARRYALAAMVGVAPEDDDGNAGSGKRDAQVANITPDLVDMDKVRRGVDWFKGKIDEEQIEVTWKEIQDTWAKLSNNERLEIESRLKDKASDSKKMYSRILKEYLSYTPTEGVAS